MTKTKPIYNLTARNAVGIESLFFEDKWVPHDVGLNTGHWKTSGMVKTLGERDVKGVSKSLDKLGFFLQLALPCMAIVKFEEETGRKSLLTKVSRFLLESKRPSLRTLEEEPLFSIEKFKDELIEILHWYGGDISCDGHGYVVNGISCRNLVSAIAEAATYKEGATPLADFLQG